MNTDALIAEMWQRFRGMASDRVTLLEDCAAALADGTATEQQRADAVAAAHKLAGSLGTYGRPGSDVARELEHLLQDGGDLRRAPALLVALREAVDAPA